MEVRGFKRFRKELFAFAPLTVLTGVNGSGKTSLLQAILIASEAGRSESGTLRLNGPFGLQLGTTADVLNWQSAAPIEVLVTNSDNIESIWSFDVAADDALYLQMRSQITDKPEVFSKQPRGFTYLSAERLGPRSYSGTSPVPDEYLEVGNQGENCAHVLSVLGDKVIEYLHRTHPDRPGGTASLLKYEVEQWLGEIARPVEIKAERYPGTSVTELRFRSPGAEWVRAPNMGFGISHALPIVLGGLIARPDGILIVENPEAHLHPSGQSHIGIFLAWLAGKGVQIVLETHSDHVLNGIRRAIAERRYLPPEAAIAHFFGGGEAADESSVAEMLTFNQAGSVSHWPPGFFDQYQIDVASLGRVRRQR